MSPLKKFLVATVVILSFFVVVTTQQAHAAVGYFTGNNYPASGHDLMHNLVGVGTIDGLVGNVHACLDGVAPCDSYNGPLAASYIILTMMGDGDHSINRARTIFPQWEATVRWYDANGRIGYSTGVGYTINTLMVNSLNDIVQYGEGGFATSIRFYNPNGSTYDIKKDCANPIGDLNALSIPTPPPTQSNVQGYVVDESGAAVNTVTNQIHTHLSGISLTQDNPFYINNFPAGNRLFEGVVQASSDYEFVGSTICDVRNCVDPGSNSGGWYYQAGSRVWDFQAGQTYNARIIVRKKRAVMQGYVIMQGGAAVGGGTVHVSSVGTSSSNPFYIGGIGDGNRQFFLAPPPAGYEIVGSNICRETGSQAGIPTCLPGDNMSSPGGAGWFAGNVRNVDFQPNIIYNSRWIIRPTFSCTMVLSPNLIDPNTPFTVTGTATFNSSAAALAAYGSGANQMNFNLTGPMPATRTVVSNSPSGSSITGVASFGNVGTAGDYTLTMQLGGTFSGITCSTRIMTIAYMPTFTARNGDLVAGMSLPAAGTGNACGPPDTHAGIVGWNQAQSTTPRFIGTGGNFGAMALSAIQGYVTNSANLTPTPSGGSLSFANSPAASYSYVNDNGAFGGYYGGYVSSCTADYYGQVTTETGTTNQGNNWSAPSLASLDGAHRATGNVTLSGGNIPMNRHIRIYVDGNVRITGNISIANGTSDLSTRDRIPSIWIIATGNIYIAPNVTDIYGILVAQGKTGITDSGAIYTCTPTGFVSFVPGTSTYDFGSCVTNKLVFNGSVIAKRMVLNRSSSTVGASATQEYSETFNFSPLTWLSPTGMGTGSNSSILSNDYQSITSLPPVL